MDRTLIAQRVATKLFATEDAVDAAMMEASQLLAGLIEARREIGFSAVLGAEAFSKVSLAVSALGDSRRALVEAHNDLNEAKLRLGVRTRMFGTGPKGYLEEGENNVVERRRVS